MEDRFWRAIGMAVGSALPEDLADVGRYVASRGDGFVAYFETYLDRLVSDLRTSGVPEVLRREARTSDDRRFADLSVVEIERYLEGVVVLARKPRVFGAILADAGRVGGPRRFPFVDLRREIEGVRTEVGAGQPLWLERPGDCRRDGDPWIVIQHGWGPGTGGPHVPPGNKDAFRSRFEKVELLASLDEDWRAWRSEVNIKALTVTIEHGRRADEPERIVLTRKPRSRAVAVVYRDVERVRVDDDPAAIGTAEAREALDLVRAAISSPH